MAHCICTVGKDGHFTGPAEEVECADDKDRPSPILAIVGERLPILVLHDEAGFLFIDGRWGRLKKRSGQSAPDGSELSGTPSQLCATGASRSHASWCVKGLRLSLFLKSPQVSIAPVAALWLEPRVRVRIIRLLVVRQDPYPAPPIHVGSRTSN
jgi:hypothetical protein